MNKVTNVTEIDALHRRAHEFNYAYLQPGEDGLSEKLVAAYQPFTPHAEAIRSLRSQLTLRWLDQEHKQLALVGLDSGEYCSFLVANLAIVFSQLGQRTVLVDANLRNPRQHQLFNLGEQQGLSDLLAGKVGMEAIVKIPSFANLYFLPAGTLPPNPQELLGGTAFKRLMRELAKSYDVTLLDTPDGLLYADTQNIAAAAGSALMVVEKDRTRLSDALALQSQITHSKAQVIGVVLNEF
jgi:chain length determinant protein tyrosine kinase EpsG